jgi:C1A family cysteine protease
VIANRRRGLGWRPDLPDHRDLFMALSYTPRTLPEQVDLRPKMPPVYDQGQLGSCTANAIGAALEYLDEFGSHPDPLPPSRLFIYFNERDLEGTTDSDAGAAIRDGIKAVVHLGFCPEQLWPYDERRFTERPPQAAYDAARKDLVTSYRRIVPTARHLTSCLAAGFPFVFGFTAYESLESAATAQSGLITMPGRSERVIGGHAVLAVGYDTTRRLFTIRNSWGSEWGDHGYGYMPFSYLLGKLSTDFWTIRASES